MNVDRLVAMANDIAAFFHSEPDERAAAEQMASHLKRFWEPRMRHEIGRHLVAGGEGLQPLARRAVALMTESP